MQRQHRLKTVMQSFRIQTIYHTAAYKHVPLVEFNIIEGCAIMYLALFMPLKQPLKRKLKPLY